MGKRLSTQDKLKRARAEGYSRKELAKAYGVSVSTVGRAERGRKTSIDAVVREFHGLGKRAKANVISGLTSLPSAKPPAPPKAPKAEKAKEAEIILSPIEKAEEKLKEMFDNDKVVFYVHLPNKTIPLGAHGGIKVGTVFKAPSLEDFLAVQGGDQGYKIDWSQVVSVTFEEYY